METVYIGGYIEEDEMTEGVIDPNRWRDIPPVNPLASGNNTLLVAPATGKYNIVAAVRFKNKGSSSGVVTLYKGATAIESIPLAAGETVIYGPFPTNREWAMTTAFVANASIADDLVFMGGSYRVGSE